MRGNIASDTAFQHLWGRWDQCELQTQFSLLKCLERNQQILDKHKQAPTLSQKIPSNPKGQSTSIPIVRSIENKYKQGMGWQREAWQSSRGNKYKRMSKYLQIS